jgi:hypothetical protein
MDGLHAFACFDEDLEQYADLENQPINPPNAMNTMETPVVGWAGGRKNSGEQ